MSIKPLIKDLSGELQTMIAKSVFLGANVCLNINAFTLPTAQRASEFLDDLRGS
jgi:hypothetical protein